MNVLLVITIDLVFYEVSRLAKTNSTKVVVVGCVCLLNDSFVDLSLVCET